MKTKTVGWAITLVLGVALLGASGGDDGKGVARAAGHAGQAGSADESVTMTDTARTAPAAVAPGVKTEVAAASADSKAKTLRSTEELASTSVKMSSTPGPIEALGGVCPKGMTEVEGDYCATVEQTCLRWLDPDEKMRCAEFAPATRCEGKQTHKHFCIDAYEYPNEPGAKPIVMKSWYEARNACTAEGKRLCGDSEWTLACEGQERMPYPYGYARNADACNIDKPHPDVDENAIANPATRQAEVDRLWQGETSGSREACVSPYGVHDMTGNVNEWVVNESAKPYHSGLKGGYWGPVRDRCRPMTTAHNEDFLFYQIGFRCCEDAPAPGAMPPAPKAPAVTAPSAPSGGSSGPSSINSGLLMTPASGQSAGIAGS